MSLADEITALSARYYERISAEHHKDRDCHWGVEKMWSYGNPPYYRPWHDGYINSRWNPPKCYTASAAERVLRDFLVECIKGVEQWNEENDDQHDAPDRVGVPGAEDSGEEGQGRGGEPQATSA